MIRRVSFLFTFLTEYTSHSSVKIKHFFFRKPASHQRFKIQHLLFLRISSRDNKKTKTWWSNHHNGGYHTEINAKYTSEEKMSMPMPIPFISLRTFKFFWSSSSHKMTFKTRAIFSSPFFSHNNRYF